MKCYGTQIVILSFASCVTFNVALGDEKNAEKDELGNFSDVTRYCVASEELTALQLQSSNLKRPVKDRLYRGEVTVDNVGAIKINGKLEVTLYGRRSDQTGKKKQDVKLIFEADNEGQHKELSNLNKGDIAVVEGRFEPLARVNLVIREIGVCDTAAGFRFVRVVKITKKKE